MIHTPIMRYVINIEVSELLLYWAYTIFFLKSNILRKKMYMPNYVYIYSESHYYS